MKRKLIFSISVAVLASLLLLITLNLPSRGTVGAALPLPITVPLPDTVYHTDAYGYSMASDGDMLVVGAPWTRVNGVDPQGMVYLFTRSANDPTAFTLLKSITSSISADRNHFGIAVSIHAETLAVGAWRDDGTESVVYLYQRNQGGANNWGEVKKLVREDRRTTTGFGRSLALHGDTLVIGAKDGQSQLGEVLLYQRNQGGENSWGKTQTLTAGLPLTTTIRNIEFGKVIAFDGTRLAVSAPEANVSAQDLPPASPAPAFNLSGAVYVFSQVGGQWVQEAKLLSGDIDLATNYYGKEYGATLSLNGDLLFVGEPEGKTNGMEAGKVYVYQRGAGIPSLYGQPGEWGEIAELTPNDGVARDRFGRALYAVDDGLFVSAEKQGVGRVYFFRNPGIMSGSRVDPRSALAWSHLYSFTTSTEGFNSGFGVPLTGSGNTVLMGDKLADLGRGGIIAYAKDVLFAVDPNATPVPTPISTATPVPPIIPPAFVLATCGRSDVITDALTARVYLPLITSVTSSLGSTHAVTPTTVVESEVVQSQAESSVFVATLVPGEVVSDGCGVKLGATTGAITTSLLVTIAATLPPTVTLPTSSIVRGDYLWVAAAHDHYAQMDSPFVFAVPVPASADPAHLVLLHTYAAESLVGSDITGTQWSYIPGVYDATSKLFLARLPYLLDEGTILVLANDGDFDTPANPTQLDGTIQAATTDQPATQSFTAHCLSATFASPADCTLGEEIVVKNMMSEIYHRMTNEFHYPKKLRLQDSGGQFIVSQSVTITGQLSDYSVYIVSKRDRSCIGALGFYSPRSGFVALCYTAGAPLDDATFEILIHELFHAIQYTYPTVMSHYSGGLDEDWIIEGMAEAAKKSYPGTTMKRSPFYGIDNLQNVDKTLTVGQPNDGNIEEYLAQDFWVYVGASQGVGLEYLGEILAIGGARQRTLNLAFKEAFDKSFSELYWGWVKHQTIENTYDIGLGAGQLCKWNKNALFSNEPILFPVSKQYYPFGTQHAYDFLQPLTAKVIEIDFGSFTSNFVSTEYHGCAYLQDSIAKATCEVVAQSKLKVKIYVEDEAGCWNDPLSGVSGEGTRLLSNLLPNNRYFVVVANSDPNKAHGYFIGLSD